MLAVDFGHVGLRVDGHAEGPRTDDVAVGVQQHAGLQHTPGGTTSTSCW